MNESPMMSHLLELRRRILWVVFVFLTTFLVMAPWSKHVYAFLAAPLSAQLPHGSSMIAIDVAAPFFVPLKVTLAAAFVLTLPHTLYQIWAFVAPGLYRHEKRFLAPVVISGVVLFFTGMLFVYFLILPLVFHFLSSAVPDGVVMATDIDKYISFVLGMFMAFGGAFELPVLVVLLYAAGVISLKKLQSARPYVIVASFAVAAIVTPPDVLSQILLAVPMVALYQVSLWVCRMIPRPSEDEAA